MADKLLALSLNDSRLPWLEQTQLGGSEKEVRLRLGDRPVLLSVARFYQQGGRQMPPPLAAKVYKAYRMYVLEFSMGLMKESIWQTVQQVGMEVRFPPSSKGQILDVFPRARFVKRVGGELKFEGVLGANGAVEVADQQVDLLDGGLGVEFGGKLRATTDNSFIGQFSFAVMEAEIKAIGANSTHGEWMFYRTDKPLDGEDIKMYAVVLVHKDEKELQFEQSAYAVVSVMGGFMASRRQSKPQLITISLADA